MVELRRLRRARRALVETLSQEGINDQRVLEAIGVVPREDFVPLSLRARAYENHALPIAQDQTISQPYIVARMSEALHLSGGAKVLEVGTGSGYQAAVLAYLAGLVFTVERLPELSWHAQATLAALGVGNVHFGIGNGRLGWPSRAPFDGIIVTATAPAVPQQLLEQLDDGGVLVMPVGGSEQQSLYAYHKRGARLDPEFLCECRFVPLIDDPPANGV